MERAYFTINEAEAHLPALSTLTKRLQLLKRRLDRYEYTALQRVTTDGREELLGVELGEMYDADLHGIKEEFYQAVERIESRGCILRDVDEGVIDFYTKFEGREVFICWQLGERRITQWHELDEGSASRKEIVDLR